jgi:hypothetical protein
LVCADAVKQKREKQIAAVRERIKISFRKDIGPVIPEH